MQSVRAGKTVAVTCSRSPRVATYSIIFHSFFTDRWWISLKLTSFLSREIVLSNWPITSWLLDGLARGPWASTISTSWLWAEMVETTNLWNIFSYMFDILAACLRCQLISRNKVELHWIKWTAYEIKISEKKISKTAIKHFPTVHNGRWEGSSITLSYPSPLCTICCLSGRTHGVNASS